MRASWVRGMLLAAVLYIVVGIVFAALAGAAASTQGRTAWRLAAWVLSLAIFAGQIAYESVRLRNASVSIGLHAAFAVALGAFGLAVAAFLHSQGDPTHQHRVTPALFIWPLMTGIPAFLAGWAIAAVAGSRRAPPQ